MCFPYDILILIGCAVMQTLLSASCLTDYVHVSMRTSALMEPLCMSIALVNESGYGQLGK